MIFFFFFESLPKDVLLLIFRERGREGERERETSVQERNILLVAFCMCPNWGLNLPPRYVLWPGIEPTTFWHMGRCFNQLSHPARAVYGFLYVRMYYWVIRITVCLNGMLTMCLQIIPITLLHIPVIIPSLHMRHRKVKYHTKGHTASEW